MSIPKPREALSRADLERELRAKRQFCEIAGFDRASVNVEDRTVDLAWASEEPYERWWGVEILDMKASSVDMARMKNGAALLLNHDPDQQIGVVENARIGSDKKARATVRFSKSALGEEILQDVKDGIRTKTSVGYQINELVLEKQEGDLSTYRVTGWTPYEISIVSVPADDTVGVGRSATRYKQKEAEMTQQADPAAGREQPGNDPLVDSLNSGDEAARAQERVKIAKRNEQIIGLGAQWPQYGGPELALKAIADPNVTVDSFRASMLKLLGEKHRAEVNTGALEADRHQTGTPFGMAPREMLASSSLKAFNGIGKIMGKTDQEVAYRAGMWAMAAIHGNPRAIQWCKDAGVQLVQGSREQLGFSERAMTEGVFTSAGWLVPVEMEAAIIANREDYGVARRIANVIPMSSASTNIPRITADATAYFVGEGTSGTQSDPAGDQVTLTLKDLMVLTHIGKSTAMDTVVSLAEMVAREQARAFAVKEDACLISGDGTSTYGGMLGLKTLLDNASYTAGKAVAAGGHNLLTEIDVSDVTSVLGILPVYARAGARWLCSGVFDAVVFGRLKLNAGGNTVQTVQGRVVEGDYAGFPITVAHHMPAGAATDYASQCVLLLGNFNLGVAFGSGNGMMLTVDPYTLAHQNLTRIITSERIDINCHGVAKSTTAGQQGPIVGLHATT